MTALERALGYVMIIQALMVAFILLWAAPIVQLVLGSKFTESAEVLRALTPYVFLNGLGPMLFSSLNYAGEGRRRIPIAIATVLAAAAFCVPLIPAIGILGAAIAADGAFALYVGGHLWFSHRFIGLPLKPLATTAVRSLMAAGATAGILALVGTSSLSVLQWALGLVAGGAAFIAVLLVTRELSATEIRFLGRLPAKALRGG